MGEKRDKRTVPLSRFCLRVTQRNWFFRFRPVSVLEVEQRVESCEAEHVHDVVVDVPECHLMSARLDVLEQAEQDAQSAGGDIVEFCAFDNEVFIVCLTQGGECLLGFGGGGGVELAFEGAEQNVVKGFDGGCHMDYDLIDFLRVNTFLCPIRS